MAVLVEAISVIVRRDAIEKRFRGGWRGFVNAVPNGTLCADDVLARVGFMSPRDVEAFVRHLEENGLIFIRNGQAMDISVVDQMRGPTIPTVWVEFGHLPLDGTKNKVAVCWCFEGPRLAAGVHIPAEGMTIATPDGWTYEDSLSANFKFVGNDEVNEKMKFLRHDNGIDVYLDLFTGREVYVAHTIS